MGAGAVEGLYNGTKGRRGLCRETVAGGLK